MICLYFCWRDNNKTIITKEKEKTFDLLAEKVTDSIVNERNLDNWNFWDNPLWSPKIEFLYNPVIISTLKWKN